MPKPLRILLVFLVLGGIGYFVWSKYSHAKTDPNKIEVAGRIEGDDSTLASKVAGRIKEIKFREGDSVKAGDVIAVLDDEQIRAREQQAQSAVDQAQARVMRAQQQIAIFNKQIKGSVVSEQQAKVDAESRALLQHHRAQPHAERHAACRPVHSLPGSASLCCHPRLAECGKISQTIELNFMNHKVQEIIIEIEAVRQSLYDAVAELNQAQMDFKPTPERWSISENLSHLNKVERGLPKLYTLLLQKIEEAGLKPETEGSMLQCLDQEWQVATTQKFQAPERVHPQTGLTKTEVLTALQQSRQAVLAALAPAGEYDLSGVTWPHPALGDINFYQWVLFIGKHEQRHLGQIQALKKLF